MTSISDTEVVNAPGGLVELGYKENPGLITVDTTATGASGTLVIDDLTVVCDGSPIIVEFFSPSARPPNTLDDSVYVTLMMDGAEQARNWIEITSTSTTASDYDPIHAVFRMTPSAGSHTFSVRARNTGGSSAARIGRIQLGSSGTGAATGYAPGFLRVSKIIQASQLLVTQSNAPIVTSLPSGNLVTGQQVSLYSTSPYAGYQRQMWDGTQWNIMGDSRANTSWQTYNPIFKQGASTISSTISYARYMVMGKTCFVRTRIVASGAGTAPNIISTTVPIAPLNAGYVNGIFVFSDVNPGVNYAALTPIVGSDLVVYGYGFQRGNGFGADPSLAVASGDVIEIALTYEVA